MSHEKPGRPPTTSVRVYWLLKREPGISYREAAKILGVSYTAVKMAAFKLRNDGFSVSKFCPYCLKPSVIFESGQYVCGNCGVILLEEQDGEIERPDVAFANASSLIHDDKGLGLSCEGENKLALRLRLKSGTSALRSYAPYSDPGFVRLVLKYIREWGRFPDGDFEVSEAVAAYARKRAREAMIHYAELTRGLAKRLAIQVLAEAYRVYGPMRVRPPPQILEEIKRFLEEKRNEKA